MSPMNNNNCKDYQTVLEEQTPLVCNDAVENKSSSTRLVTLLSIGIAVFACLAMAGQHVSHGNSILKLEAALADHHSALYDHQSQLEALTVESTPLLGTALEGYRTGAIGDLCVDDNECESRTCIVKPYASCAVKKNNPLWGDCTKDRDCASDYCDRGGVPRYMGTRSEL